GNFVKLIGISRSPSVDSSLSVSLCADNDLDLAVSHADQRLNDGTRLPSIYFDSRPRNAGIYIGCRSIVAKCASLSVNYPRTVPRSNGSGMNGSLTSAREKAASWCCPRCRLPRGSPRPIPTTERRGNEPSVCMTSGSLDWMPFHLRPFFCP